VPDYGLTRFPDASLYDGIKSFQRDTGLKVDGIAKPDGPTIQTLGQRVSQLKSSITPSDYQKAASKSDAPTPEECDYHFHKVDIPVCNAIKRRRGKQASARCFHSAAVRYAACLHGTPLSQLPPLDTWNN
jgi:peptidoglycan hydrolase-like protein with peptidoglycan-binding domain